MDDHSPQVRCAAPPQVYAPPAAGPIRSLVYMANVLLAFFYLVLALLVSAPPSDKPCPTQGLDVPPPRPYNKALFRASRRKATSLTLEDAVQRVHALLDVMLRTSLQPQQALAFVQTVLRPLATASATYAHACPTVDALALELKIRLATRKLYAECPSSYVIEPSVGESHLVQHL
ncbi:hypothetical protein PHLGIDRAFT_469887 [Phlebiopsis gigantea 11061_1 CR5-6]|uniref:Uncharacterized protein n=1 Tax=Phlebiopsis gigantea (strain 11061_1 CR5-6) TaxID=745531 RepID=A0A0C3S6G0_PHLG1|nr:hypothetical protein PHLGIDRAFT_469887 [Phlebiopsis gigantea 11061_1 CR5-6]